LNEQGERRRRKLYGRRKGPRLSAHQQSLFDTLLPTFALAIRDKANPCEYFSPPPEEVWLEVGFGGGEHLLAQAQAHPRVGMIGAEPYESGVAKLLSKLESAPVPNLRIYMDDARDIIEALPDASIARVFTLFPDPWPKTRHHKRRFVQMQMLDQLARVLKPRGELRFASDDAGYLNWALERLMAHKAFEWAATRATDWKTRPLDQPQTRYETKALHGPPAYLIFRKVG
jgi:tRNA (guanine-N7-)-methyltransferase